jgi:outer membrane biosynthesis protein TonB
MRMAPTALFLVLSLNGARADDAYEEWTKQIQAELACQIYYPIEAKRNRESGTVVLVFTLDSSGKVADIKFRPGMN